MVSVLPSEKYRHMLHIWFPLPISFHCCCIFIHVSPGGINSGPVSGPVKYKMGEHVLTKQALEIEYWQYKHGKWCGKNMATEMKVSKMESIFL
jgi:hypothetical protein